MVIIRFLLATILIGAITGCDRSQSSYDSAAEARSAGAFDRGWFPEFIPRDARDLYEFHHIDDPWTWGSFRVSSGEWATELRPAVEAEKIRIRRPPKGVTWPDSLVGEITTEDARRNGFDVFVHREGEGIHERTVYVFVSLGSDMNYFHRRA
ncbi:MAG: hypothetical protein ACREQV_06625 [Candidatus Binatia bacterium]